MDPTLVALAKAAGLDKALALFPDDIESAVTQALGHTDGFKVPVDPTVEPWPPMKTEGAL